MIRLLLIFAGLLLAGCATSPKLPPVNLQEGWESEARQAIWRPKKGAPELVGDLILARNPAGDQFIQFSKGIPILSAHSASSRWEITFHPLNRTYGGSGQPPRRFIWFHLFPNSKLSRNWRISHRADSTLYRNGVTGETLEVFPP